MNMKWIKTSDRLPDRIGSYLVYETIENSKMIAWAFFNSGKKWAGGNVFYENVTHWMPLPAPPKD